MIIRLTHCVIDSYGQTDLGLVRQNNEDAWDCLDHLPLYVVADGMGGHKAGEVASDMAIKNFIQFFKIKFSEYSSLEMSLEALKNIFFEGIKEINQNVYQKGRSLEGLRGMGTTFCALFFYQDKAVLAHVGDSRIYRLREGELSLLTQDHSLVRALINRGELSEKEGDRYLYKNIITKAIGVEKTIEPSIQTLVLKSGDTFLICTDGLSDMLSLKEIEMILKQPVTLKEMTLNLIKAANFSGGLDNITAVIVKVTFQ